MRKFDVEAVGMGTNNEYAGAFTKPIRDLIKSVVTGSILHLFSGSSFIGEERIDIEHPHATINCNVRAFVETDDRHWDFIVLDPPYAIMRADTKLKTYGQSKAISSDVTFRRKLKYYLQTHADNILWLDFCAPTIKGFTRKKLWLVLSGGFHTVRVLLWLQKEMELLI